MCSVSHVVTLIWPSIFITILPYILLRYVIWQLFTLHTPLISLSTGSYSSFKLFSKCVLQMGIVNCVWGWPRDPQFDKEGGVCTIEVGVSLNRRSSSMQRRDWLESVFICNTFTAQDLVLTRKDEWEDWTSLSRIESLQKFIENKFIL